MQTGKKVRHLKTSVTINPNRMLLSACSLTTGKIISEGAFLALNLDKGPSIYYVSKGLGGSRKWPLCTCGWVSQKKSKIICIAWKTWKNPTFPRKLLTATNFDNVATLSGNLSKLQL